MMKVREVSSWIIAESALILDDEMSSYVLVDMLNDSIWDAKLTIRTIINDLSTANESEKKLSASVQSLHESLAVIDRKLKLVASVTRGDSISQQQIKDLVIQLNSIDVKSLANTERTSTDQVAPVVQGDLLKVQKQLLEFERATINALKYRIDNRLQFAIWEKWMVHLVSLACFCFVMGVTLMTSRSVERMKIRELSQIKELHHSQLQLDQQRALIVESSRLVELGVLAGGISHEIRTPLSVIMGFAEHARRKADAIGDASLQKNLQRITDTSRKLLKMLDGFRAMSRTDAVSQSEVTTFQNLMEFPKSMIEKSASLADVTIEIDSTDAEKTFVCMPVQIGQVLLNLLKNSIDEMEKLDERWIKVSCVVDDKQVAISVTDSGKGIPEDIREKLMTDRFTTKSSTKGTGLGLNISAEICRNHSGTLSVNAQCENTQFVISLPRFKSVEDLKAFQANKANAEIAT
jgi:signal transduction histidine kinase